MLEKTIEIGLLFDYYGKMLTEKQQKIMRLYYYHDLSLGEIAEKLDISRQGVYDHLNRGEKLLRNYEQEMQLISRYQEYKQEIDKIITYIDKIDIENKQKKELIKRIENLRNIL